MAIPRFYLAPDAWSIDSLQLHGEEAHHCISVLRRGVGKEIEIFDGQGRRALTRISAQEGKSLQLECLNLQQTPAPQTSITLLQAVPKGSNMDWIIEKAVELGVNAIRPVITQHSVVKIPAAEAVKKQVKWQRTALEACKQCGQDWLPIIHQPVTLAETWSQLDSYDKRYIAALHDDSKPFTEHFQQWASTPASVLIAVGPEGDFSSNEYAMAMQHNFDFVSLGSLILRVETASFYCLSVLKHHLR